MGKSFATHHSANRLVVFAILHHLRRSAFLLFSTTNIHFTETRTGMEAAAAILLKLHIIEDLIKLLPFLSHPSV